MIGDHVHLPNLFKRKNAYEGAITNVNIYWKNAMHALPGMKLNNRVFELRIPFTNKSPDNLSFLKKQNNVETIESIEVKDPFKLLSCSQNLPISISTGNSVEFVLKVEAPDYNYSGPIVLKMNPKPVESVHIELPEIMAVCGEKRVKVNEHGEVKNVEKGGAFEVSMQMYRILEYNDAVKGVSVNKPFEFVSSDPKLPFTIDNKSSYVASFEIKAPEFNYAGVLELVFDKA